MSSCCVKTQTYSNKYAAVPKNIQSLVVCRAVGGSTDLNKNIAKSLENEMRIHLDSLIGNEQVNELLQQNGIFQYDDYSNFLIQKIANLTGQRFIIIPHINNFRESIEGRDNNFQTSFIDISYYLYDSLGTKLLFSTHIKAKGDEGIDPVNLTLNAIDRGMSKDEVRYPSEIAHSLTKIAKEATEKLFNYIGILYDKEATYKVVSKEEYERDYIAH